MEDEDTMKQSPRHLGAPLVWTALVGLRWCNMKHVLAIVATSQ